MGYLVNALRGTGPAPNRLYAVLMAACGLITLGLGIGWALEERPAVPEIPAKVRELLPEAARPPSRPSRVAEGFRIMAVVTALLGLSWWATRRKFSGPSGPRPSRGDRPRRDPGGDSPVGL